MLNVLIADAQPLARNGLQMLVEQLVARRGEECVVAYSDDALTAFRKAKRLQPDLILFSSELPFAGGVQAVLALRQYTPDAKLVVINGGEDAMLPRAYLSAGADGVLCKTQPVPELEEALNRVLGGGDQAARVLASGHAIGKSTKKAVPLPGTESQ